MEEIMEKIFKNTGEFILQGRCIFTIILNVNAFYFLITLRWERLCPAVAQDQVTNLSKEEEGWMDGWMDELFSVRVVWKH